MDTPRTAARIELYILARSERNADDSVASLAAKRVARVQSPLTPGHRKRISRSVREIDSPDEGGKDGVHAGILAIVQSARRVDAAVPGVPARLNRERMRIGEAAGRIEDRHPSSARIVDPETIGGVHRDPVGAAEFAGAVPVAAGAAHERAGRIEEADLLLLRLEHVDAAARIRRDPANVREALRSFIGPADREFRFERPGSDGIAGLRRFTGAGCNQQREKRGAVEPGLTHCRIARSPGSRAGPKPWAPVCPFAGGAWRCPRFRRAGALPRIRRQPT